MSRPATVNSVPLGRTSLRIPPLGVGAWAWGDRVVWGYGSGHGRVEVEAAFDASLDRGIRFFDTAEIYGFGTSERLLGEFGRDREPPPILATKFFPYPWRLSRGSLRRALAGSLSRLRSPRIDLYFLHHVLPPVPLVRWLEAMADSVEAGLIRTIGISNCTADELRRAHEALARRGIPLAAVQVEYSLLAREPERNGIQSACDELGVSLIAYSPLAMGLLTGKYGATRPPPGVRRLRYGRLLPRIRSLLGLMVEIGQGNGGKTPVQVALNWLISKGAVPIPGAKNRRQATENAGATGWSLSRDEVSALDGASM